MAIYKVQEQSQKSFYRTKVELKYIYGLRPYRLPNVFIVPKWN